MSVFLEEISMCIRSGVKKSFPHQHQWASLNPVRADGTESRGWQTHLLPSDTGVPSSWNFGVELNDTPGFPGSPLADDRSAFITT